MAKHLLDFGEGYKAGDHKVIIVNLFSTTVLYICDPQLAQELFTKQNKFIDKTGKFEEIFEDIMGKSFLFAKGDEDWNRKRKACAHAFYKDRMECMLEVLKDKLDILITGWNREIEASPNGKCTTDIAIVFEKLFCSMIVHICFGEDVSDMPVETDFFDP